MKKISSTLLIIALVLSLLTGCASKGKDKVVTINSSGNYIVAALIVMKEEKILEKYLPEGYTVNWTTITTSTEIRDGMLTGDIDISAPALSTTISALENDIPFRILSYMATPVYKLYASAPDVKSIHDLGAEDRISITGYAGSMHLAFLAYCAEELGDLNSLAKNLVVMPNSEALASLTSGSDVAANVFQFSNNLMAEKAPEVHCIGDLTEVTRQYGIGQICVTTEDYYAANPEIVEAFLSAQEEAIDLFYAKPDYVADLLIRSGIDIEKDDLLEAMTSSGPAGTLTEGQYDKLAQFMYEAGMLQNQPTPLASYDFYDTLLENNKRYD